jgi:hypothetical protein
MLFGTTEQSHMGATTANAGSLEVIGRESERAVFVQFLDEVADGPAALVLEGDAGIGKTALWVSALELGRERGYNVLSARPAEAETQLPFAGLGATVQRLRGQGRAAPDTFPHAPRTGTQGPRG